MGRVVAPFFEQERQTAMSPGHLFVISAPSGTGKTTLVRHLVERLPWVKRSVSHTTRNKRPAEKDGVDYHFIDETAFEAKVASGDFLEWARVFEHGYGTSRSWVEEQLAQGHDVLLEIDWQGALQIQKAMPSILIFVMPPHPNSLKERLESRHQDSSEVIAKRLAGAREDMSHYTAYDYLVVNDELEHAVGALVSIVQAQRHTTKHQAQEHQVLLEALLQEELF